MGELQRGGEICNEPNVRLNYFHHSGGKAWKHLYSRILYQFHGKMRWSHFFRNERMSSCGHRKTLWLFDRASSDGKDLFCCPPREVVKKKRYFYGQAVRVDPPLWSGCCDFFKISWHILPFYNGKNWTKILTFAYGQGRGGWPSPSYGQPDRKNTVFFTTSLSLNEECPNLSLKKESRHWKTLVHSFQSNEQNGNPE